MAQLQFVKATKAQAKLRLCFIGIAGSGKTYTSLAVASNLGKKIAFIDTEHGSASKYSDIFNFDVMELDSYAVENFIAGIQAAEAAGYDVLIIDSLSHAWTGKDGILDFVDKKTTASNTKNAFTSGWRDATPLHNKMIDTIIASKMHVIACMRSKQEYILEDDGRGKKVPRKLTMQPIQRDGMEYEFDVVGDLDSDHNLVIGKTRCRALDQGVFKKPGKEIAEILKAWLSDGVAAPAKQTPPLAQSTPPASTQPEPEPTKESETTQTVEQAQKRLKKVFETCFNNGYNGYNNTDEGRALIKADLKHFLDADTIAECKDIDLLNNMEAKLNEKIKSGTPFDHWDNKIVVETEAESDYPEDIAYLLETAQHEAESRDIKASLKSMLLSEAKDYADKKNIPGLNTIIASITGFPLKKAELTPDIAELHNKIDIIHGKLIDGKINNYDQSKHLTASVEKWLGTKTSKACMDVEKLTKYIKHLEAQFEPEQEKLEV